MRRHTTAAPSSTQTGATCRVIAYFAGRFYRAEYQRERADVRWAAKTYPQCVVQDTRADRKRFARAPGG